MSGSFSPNPSFDSLEGNQFKIESFTLLQAEWRTLLDATLDAMVVLDSNGGFLDGNDAACDLFCCSRTELLQASINSVTEPGFDFLDIQQKLKDQGRIRGSFCIIRQEREIREVHYTITDQATGNYHILALQDISQLKQAQTTIKQLQKTLQDQEERHRQELKSLQSQLKATQQLLSRLRTEQAEATVPSEPDCLQQISRHIPGVIYQFRMRPDGSYHFPYASEGIRETHGVSPEAVRDDAGVVFAMIHPEDLARMDESIHTSRDKGIPWYCEYRIIKNEGQIVWLLGHATPQGLADGSTIWYGYIRDITRQKELESHQRRLLAILESTSDFIGTADGSGKILYLNQVWKQLYGDEKLPKHLGETCASWVSELILKEAFPEARRLGVWRGKTAIRTPDGEEIPVEQVIMHHTAQSQEEEYFSTIIRDIRDRSTKELELQRLTRQLKEAQALGHVGNWSFDIAEQEMTWSDEVFRIFGMHPSQGEPTFEEHVQQFHPDDMTQFLQYTNEAKTGIPQDFDIRIVRPSGDIAYVNIRVQVEFNESHPVRLFGVVIDITQRKQIEDELRDEEAQTRALLNAIPDMMFRYSREAVFLDYKPSRDVAEFQDPKDFIGKNISDIFPESFATVVKGIINETFETGEPQIFEYKLPVPGMDQHFEARFVKATDTEVLSLIRDISDRKRAEQERQELLVRTQILNSISLKIRKSLNLDTILESTVTAISDELKVSFCCFGWSCVDEDGEYWQVFTECKVPDVPSFLGRYKLEYFQKVYSALRDNQPYLIGSINTCDDLSIKQLFENSPIQSYCTIPVQTMAGRLGGFHLGYTHEIPEWDQDDIWLLQEIANQVAIAIQQADLYREAKSKSEELSRAYRQLQDTQIQLLQAEKMSSLGQLVGGIAHEINNPVSFIYGNLDYAAEYSQGLIELCQRYSQAYPNPPEYICEYRELIDLDFLLDDFPKIITSMKYGATRIRDIVKSLRTFSRLDESSLKEVELHENLDSTLVLLRNRLHQGNPQQEIEVIKQYDTLPKVSCYSGLLNQVFMNLLMNAIDAIEVKRNQLDLSQLEQYKGQITLATCLTSSETVMITIHDNGCGMSASTQDKIFNPFFTTKPVGTGTGMGLPTSYQIITQSHQGKLKCESTIGNGTKFIIELPLNIQLKGHPQQ
ncbi:MAG: PAS domain S-box protein [Phormidium sp.]